MEGALATSVATRVLAHRGFHAAGGPMENTLGAFRRAFATGAQLELDVRRTLDGVIVVNHDAHVTDGRAISSLLHSQLPTHADGQIIPQLSQVAEVTRAAGSRMVVELKERGYEREVARVISDVLPPQQYELISFSPGSIKRIKQAAPESTVGLLRPRLSSWMRETALYPAAVWVLDRLHVHPGLRKAARLGADYVSVDRRMATPRYIEAARRRGLGVDVWTVNDVAQMQRLMRAGVQRVVTDHPDVALKVQAALQSPAADSATRAVGPIPA